MRNLFMIGLGACLFVGAVQEAHAQLNAGGQPVAWSQGYTDAPVVWHSTPPDAVPPIASFLASAEATRFGVQVPFDVDIIELGAMQALGDGSSIYRIGINSPGAVVMSLQFDLWDLQEGATVFVYDHRRSTFLGAFDRSNRSAIGDMATAILPGDSLVVEYHVPGGTSVGNLHIASLTHGMRDPFSMAFANADRDYDPGYQSAPCHVNINCPEAADWQREKRAVAMFLRPDGNGCTGTLINNTAQPGRPLFYAANHCYQPNTSQWVFYFNYESPGCVGSTGPTTQTLTGASTLATDYYADFALLELSNAPPASFQPYYAGWDRSGNVPQTGTVIHHPLYDVKKFASDLQPAGSYTSPEGVLLWRSYWDIGLVEAVSSGAALWDENKRIVGHMNEGAQECGNISTVSTGCAKFSAGWDGPNPNARKRDWLDPANSTTVIDGYEPFSASGLLLRPRVLLEGPFNSGNTRMYDGLRSAGLIPLDEPYTALGLTLVGGGGESTTSPVLAATGANAIVDWVVVELRSATTPTQILASRCALLQSDGDVVDVDGTSALMYDLPAASYRIAIKHRNHLGVITANAIALSSTSATVDFSDGSVALFGGGDATKAAGTRRLLYAGDVTGNGQLKYAGQANDRDPILLSLGGLLPNNTVSGYFTEDVNMDGVVRYTGTGNDRDIILVNIGGVVATNVRNASLP